MDEDVDISKFLVLSSSLTLISYLTNKNIYAFPLLYVYNYIMM